MINNIFTRHKTYSYNSGANQDIQLFVTTKKSFIVVEWTSPSNFFSRVYWKNQLSASYNVTLAIQNDDERSPSYNESLETYPSIVPAGAPIRVLSFEGHFTVHVFELE